MARNKLSRSERSFIDSPKIINFEANPVNEAVDRKLLPATRIVFQHPINDEALYYERFVNAHDPKKSKNIPDGFNIIKLRTETSLDWCCDSISDNVNIDGMLGESVDDIDIFSPMIGLRPRRQFVFPKHTEQLEVFCTVGGKMFFIALGDKTTALDFTEKELGLPAPIVLLINDIDILPSHFGTNHRHERGHS